MLYDGMQYIKLTPIRFYDWEILKKGADSEEQIRRLTARRRFIAALSARKKEKPKETPKLTVVSVEPVLPETEVMPELIIAKKPVRVKAVRLKKTAKQVQAGNPGYLDFFIKIAAVFLVAALVITLMNFLGFSEVIANLKSVVVNRQISVFNINPNIV